MPGKSIPSAWRAAGRCALLDTAFISALVLASLSGTSAGYAPVPFDRKAEVAAELARLEGTWDLVRAMQRGEDTTESSLSTFVVVKSGRWSYFVVSKDRPSTVCDIKLDLRSTPKRLDLVRFEEVEKRTMLAIYRLDGDTLTICFRYGVRPTKLDGTEKGETWYQVFRRRKAAGTPDGNK